MTPAQCCRVPLERKHCAWELKNEIKISKHNVNVDNLNFEFRYAPQVGIRIVVTTLLCAFLSFVIIPIIICRNKRYRVVNMCLVIQWTSEALMTRDDRMYGQMME